MRLHGVVEPELKGNNYGVVDVSSVSEKAS